jgi:pyridoxal phosphate enzyme (YggS family)
VLQWRALREKVVSIAENVALVRERMAAACLRARRRSEDVKLVAVTKTVSPVLIRQAYEAGVRDFGENRVQEAAAKRPALMDMGVTWHLVGHLQSNKAKPARELFQYVHSVDSLRLAERLHRVAPPGAERLPVLLEVNLGEELTKSGVREGGLVQLAHGVGQLATLELRGLMLIPPFSEDPEESRLFFRRLRELARTVESCEPPGVSMRELSMGMSHDFEVAIEEGATMVRIGTAIFGPR